jgi:hypothetical protein
MWLIYLLGGKQVRSSLASRFIPSGFELGGKDPANVRADVNLLYSAENILDGVFYIKVRLSDRVGVFAYFASVGLSLFVSSGRCSGGL